jgi:hypothetical protein
MEPIKKRPRTLSTSPSASSSYDSLPLTMLNGSIAGQAMPAASTSAHNGPLEPITTDIRSPKPTIADKQLPSKRRKTARMSTGGRAPQCRPKTEYPSPHPKPENYTLPRRKAS